MTDREPVHDEKHFFGIKKGRKMYWPNIGLLTHHDPKPKQKLLKNLGIRVGKNINRLITTSDLSYYNNGATKTSYINGKKIDYTD